MIFFVCFLCCLTLNLLTTTIVAPPSNASKWQMGFNSAFKGLNLELSLVLFQLHGLEIFKFEFRIYLCHYPSNFLQRELLWL